MNGIKHWKDWLHPIATVLGAWGGFPKPPKLFLELTRFELFRWLLVFILAYQGGAEEDIKQALIITTIFYLITKLLDLREVVSDVAYAETTSNLLAQEKAKAESAYVQEAQAAARVASIEVAQAEAAQAEAAQAEVAQAEAFYGGYYI